MPWELIECSDNAELGWFTYTQGCKIQFHSRFRALWEEKKNGPGLKSLSRLRVWLCGYILFITLLCFIVLLTS